MPAAARCAQGNELAAEVRHEHAWQDDREEVDQPDEKLLRFEIHGANTGLADVSIYHISNMQAAYLAHDDPLAAARARDQRNRGPGPSQSATVAGPEATRTDPRLFVTKPA